ncbi:MAG: signal peptidase I [Nitrospinae bacterium]|nr:signal peptidase I [Nitrospinota bacterium]
MNTRAQTALTVLFAVAVALFTRAYVAQAYAIPSESMQNTLLVGDHVFVVKLAPRLSGVARSDIVVFDGPEGAQTLIKRVVGLPGETIRIENNTVYIDGVPLAEPYAVFERNPYNPHPLQNFGPYLIPDDGYFVMGDNRNNSGDSRFFGPVPKERIIGKAFLIHWSSEDSPLHVRWSRLGHLLD